MGIPVKMIGGRKYGFDDMPALDAVDVQLVLAKALGPALLQAFSVEDLVGLGAGKKPSSEKLADAATGLLPQVVQKLLSGLDKQELRATLATVFESVVVDGERIADPNETFKGRPKELWLVFGEALKANFRSFFPEGLFDSPPSDPQT